MCHFPYSHVTEPEGNRYWDLLYGGSPPIIGGFIPNKDKPFQLGSFTTQVTLGLNPAPLQSSTNYPS